MGRYSEENNGLKSWNGTWKREIRRQGINEWLMEEGLESLKKR